MARSGTGRRCSNTSPGCGTCVPPPLCPLRAQLRDFPPSPITRHELLGRFSSHPHAFFFHIQVSEFNTADTIPLLFKGTIFPFISSPLYIITLSKLGGSCSAPPQLRAGINSGESPGRSLLIPRVCPQSTHLWGTWPGWQGWAHGAEVGVMICGCRSSLCLQRPPCTPTGPPGP